MTTICATICETNYSRNQLALTGAPHVSYYQSSFSKLTTPVVEETKETNETDPATQSLCPPPNAPTLLSLPLELRLQICSLALSSILSSSHPYSAFLSHPLPQSRLSLLLTNRQIHAETRLLPFRHAPFFFQKYLSSSVSSCLRFFNTLQPWQIRAIRTMELAVVEGDLVGWQLKYGWNEICRFLGGAGSEAGLSPQESVGSRPPEGHYPVNGDLRSLTVHIHGSLSRFAADLLHADAAWIKHGLCRLTSLRRVEIVVEDEEIGEEAMRVFEAGLRAAAGRVGGLAVLVRGGEAGSGGGKK